MFKYICMLVGIFSLISCSGEDSSKAGQAVAPVKVVQAKKENMERKLLVVGNVLPSATVGIKARVTGELIEVHFKEGDNVKEGQVLFSIDPRPFEATLREAKAIKAKNLALLRKAKDDMERYGKLVADGYISREAYDQTSTDVASLRASVKADNATIESAALQLKYCTITSPISGRAGMLQVNKGNMIKDSDADAIVIIDAFSPVYVHFAVPEIYLPDILKMNNKKPLQIIVTPTGGNSVTGILTFIDNTVDTRTGTIKIRGTFDNNSGSLWPGQFVEVELALGMINDAIIIPARAVQTGLNEIFVYIVDDDNRVQYQKVEIALEYKDQVAISSGVVEGDRVVTEGHLRLAPNVRVEIR